MDFINDNLVWIFIVGALLVGGAIALAAYMYEKKRTAAMDQAAQQLGLPFFPKGDMSLVEQLSHFKLFSKGRARKIKNMIHGDAGAVEVGIFDYQYTIGSGKNSSTHKQTVITFRDDHLTLPQFLLRPEGFFDKIGGMIGLQDIDFETHPVFSKSFVLQGESETQIREQFNPDVLTFFEENQGWTVEAGLQHLTIFKPNKRVAPEQVRSFMEDAFKIHGVLKG